MAEENWDGSPHSSVLKVTKRIAASDFSRDLSIKVYAGQCRLIGLGFRQGGPAGYGLRRQMVDHCRQPRTLLERGERKSLQTEDIARMEREMERLQQDCRQVSL